MRRRCKSKIIATLLTGVIITGFPFVNTGNNAYLAKADEYYDNSNTNLYTDDDYSDDSGVSTQNVGVNVDYHTEDEIREFVKNHPADFTSPVEYEEEPLGKAPYSLGRLKYKTLQSALNTLNQIRYIAGLSSDVVLNDEYVKQAQGASVVNSVNDVLTHNPEKPAGMSDEVYRIGAEGASHSNIAMGYNNIDTSLVFGYMEDGDSSNIDRLGHRRWLLNPSMKATGFGYYNNYTAAYALDNSSAYSPEYGVIWPAQNMPTEYFNKDFPWSISMGYAVSDSVEVELIRLSDNKTWKFSKSSADGYFNVDNGGYGKQGCIIFRPDGIERYVAGEKFRVNITGLSAPLSYEVSFFDLVPITDIIVDKIPKKMVIGGELDLNFQVLPKNAVNDLKITVDSDVLKVSNTYTKGYSFSVSINDGPQKEYNEKITANKYGKAMLKVETLDGRISKTFEITVIPDRGYIYWLDTKRMKNKKLSIIKIEVEKNSAVNGYEVLYSTNKNFKYAKKLISNSYKKTKFTINSALSRRTYYIKARAFVKVGGKKIYGAYSKTDTYRIY